MKPALFSNAQSLYNKTQLGMMRDCASSLGLTHYILDAAALAEPTHIDAMLAQAADAGTNTLVINGGDGTLDLILTRLRAERFQNWQPDVLLLRGGTTNMTHGDVGFGRDPAQALVAAMTRKKPFTPAMRRLICLSGGSLPHPQYGFFFGTHAIPRAIHATRSEFHARGLTAGKGEALMFLRVLLNLLRGRVEGDAILSPTTLHYTLGGTPQQASHVCLVATTLHRHVIGLRLSLPNNQMGCLMLTAPAQGVWRHVHSLWRGQPNCAVGPLHRWQDAELTLTLDSEVTLDGELFAATMEVPLTLSLAAPVRFLT